MASHGSVAGESRRTPGAAPHAQKTRGRVLRRVAAASGALLLCAVAGAQVPQQFPPPSQFPPQEQLPPPAPVFAPPVPTTAFPPAPAPVFAPAQPPGLPTTSGITPRQLFAGTLATVAQATGTSLIFGLAEAITGGLTGWFSRKPATVASPQALAQPALQPGVAAATPPFPETVPPPSYAPPTYVPPVSGDASTAAQPAYTPPAMPVDPSAPPTYSPPASGAVAPAAGGALQFFDPRTGSGTAADPMFAAAPPMGSTGSDLLVAGLAYEVHAVRGGGATEPVNPATHEFRTGDRFVVFYRPTLPGRMEVYNINPAGQQTQIDVVELAAGQLARLGPYEFAAMTGDDQLRLVLAPCSTAALFAATRDIVRVADTPPVGTALGLAACGGPATRSIQGVATRDIRKVALDGTTGFALDPLSSQERTSGQVVPREITIVFKHR